MNLFESWWWGDELELLIKILFICVANKQYKFQTYTEKVHTCKCCCYPFTSLFRWFAEN